MIVGQLCLCTNMYFLVYNWTRILILYVYSKSQGERSTVMCIHIDEKWKVIYFSHLYSVLL